MTDANHGLLETLLSHLFQHRDQPHYADTLRELRLRLDAEANRVREGSRLWCGQPATTEEHAEK